MMNIIDITDEYFVVEFDHGPVKVPYKNIFLPQELTAKQAFIIGMAYDLFENRGIPVVQIEQDMNPEVKKILAITEEI